MKYVKKQELYTTTERLNQILDKISVSSQDSLTKFEKEFLDSFSIGKEDEMNDRLSEIESEEFFMSDDGLFSFKYDGMEFDSDVVYYKGVLTIPIKKRKKMTSEVLYGSIIVYNDYSWALDFLNTKKIDLVELDMGYECELDVFIDDVVSKLQNM